MAVSKRLRYEVLRRDNHTCRYCGASAPDAKLTVDHVLPTALGGTDEPSNLVAACEDCNAGKSASTPDAALIDDVEQDAIRWAAAMKRAAEIQAQHAAYEEEVVRSFDQLWCGWTNDDMPLPRPDGWSTSIRNLVTAGAQWADLRYALDVAMDNRRISNSTVFKYFCGVAWRVLRDRREIAGQLLAGDEGDQP